MKSEKAVEKILLYSALVDTTFDPIYKELYRQKLNSYAREVSINAVSNKK